MSLGKCRGCGERIRWGRLGGKAHPYDLDGTSHFDTCVNASKFRGGGINPSYIYPVRWQDWMVREEGKSRFVRLGDVVARMADKRRSGGK